MTFRFRRTVKLLPGVRLNITKCGISTSVGVPGARVTLSKRGVSRTFGIPGSGMFWSERVTGNRRQARDANEDQSDAYPETLSTSIGSLDDLETSLANPSSSVVYAETGRRLSDRQIESARRRFLQEERRHQAIAEVEKSEQHLQNVLNCWRETSDIPQRSFYEEACRVREFRFEEPPPPKPDRNTETGRLRTEAAVQLRHSSRPSAALKATVIAVSAVSGVFSAAMLGMTGLSWAGWLIGLVLGTVLLGTGLWFVRRSYEQELEAQVEQTTHDRWPERVAELRSVYRGACASYADRKKAAATTWTEDEHERVKWAKRLLAGDVESMNDVISDSLTDLDFPFETDCDIALTNGECAFLNLDLPEIEDVIPETCQQVLKDGRVKKVRRNKKERANDYSMLVAGLGLLLSRTAFSAAPTLESVRIAAYTQRKKRGADQVVDDYVYDVEITRNTSSVLSLQGINPIKYLVTINGRIDQKATMELKSLKPPKWIEEFTP